MPAKLIILFAKSPTPGGVKTRLFPVLSPELAAELHSAFVLDMIHRFRHLEGTAFELHTDTCSDAWQSLGVTRKLQISGDLGLKMIHGLAQPLDNGVRRVVILGSDAPTLPVDHVNQMLEADADVVLGPSSDGGFYAITARKTHASMFDGVAWSQRDTLERTIQAIERCGLSVAIGPEWFDVDEPADLIRLMREEVLPTNTAACLANLKAQLNIG